MHIVFKMSESLFSNYFSEQFENYLSSWDEINSIKFDDNKGILWAACGDNITRAYNLKTGKLLTSLEGHTDYVHDVAIRYDIHLCIHFE